jgi:hypothetical protein
MTAIRLPSWGEVLDGPWALRLRSGATGAWLMRGEAETVTTLACRFLAGAAARTTNGALAELAAAFELDEPLGRWDDLPHAVAGVDGALALLVIDADRLLADEPEQLAPLVAALRAAADRVLLRVIFQARVLAPDAEAVLAEFGVEDIRG